MTTLRLGIDPDTWPKVTEDNLDQWRDQLDGVLAEWAKRVDRVRALRDDAKDADTAADAQRALDALCVQAEAARTAGYVVLCQVESAEYDAAHNTPPSPEHRLRVEARRTLGVDPT